MDVVVLVIPGCDCGDGYCGAGCCSRRCSNRLRCSRMYRRVSLYVVVDVVNTAMRVVFVVW